MGLLRKVRVLVGALVQRPFEPRREKANLEDEGQPHAEPTREPGQPTEPAREPAGLDDERVADLIARQQRRENS